MNSVINNENPSFAASLDNIYRLSKNSRLNQSSLLKMKHDLEIVAAYINSSEIQALLFSIIFGKNFESYTVNIRDLADHLNCTPTKIANLYPDLLQLENKRLIRRENDPRSVGINYLQYYIPRQLGESLLNGSPALVPDNSSLDLVTLLERFGNIFEDKKKKTLSFDEMNDDLVHLITMNNELPFIKRLNKIPLKETELILLLYVCYEAMNGNHAVDMTSNLGDLFDCASVCYHLRKDLIRGTSHLIQKDLLTLEDGPFRGDRFIILTDRAICLLFEEELDMANPVNAKGIILPETIIPKNLFFNQESQKHLDELTALLEQTTFSQLQDRLAENKMQKGFSILFYGDPGTGKTESVYQIARQTGRPMMMIDISESKSMWYGESEKIIKSIFDQYATLVKTSKITPILLFNEADGILTRRFENSRTSADQTTNAIQNIILNEMERINGILIATTNLAGNLDHAFERRFLYKIRFDKPSPDVMAKIWKDKIPSLSDADTMHLAANFNLSGGQIENVSRKVLMKKILHNEETSLIEIIAMCKNEHLDDKRKIGYCQG